MYLLSIKKNLLDDSSHSGQALAGKEFTGLACLIIEYWF